MLEKFLKEAVLQLQLIVSCECEEQDIVHWLPGFEQSALLVVASATEHPCQDTGIC